MKIEACVTQLVIWNQKNQDTSIVEIGSHGVLRLVGPTVFGSDKYCSILKGSLVRSTWEPLSSQV